MYASASASADVARGAADHDHELRLVVELRRLLLGHGDLAAAAVERGVVLVEQDRLLRHGVAGLGRVLAIVEADADDLLRVGDARPELGLVLGDEMRPRAALAARRLKPAEVALRRRARRVIVVGAPSLKACSAAATSRMPRSVLQPEAVAGAAPQRAEGHGLGRRRARRRRARLRGRRRRSPSWPRHPSAAPRRRCLSS